MKPNIIVLWHEPSNMIATMPMNGSSLALLSVCDDEYKGINPFYAYPTQMLIDYYGWIKLGEL
jgi:hypothetical protein